MKTLFLGARYKVQHKDITEDNVVDMLSTDLRSKLMGNARAWIYPSNLNIPGTDIRYVGGFYYESGDGGQYSIVNSEMDEIDKADIVCLDFTKPHAIATIAELFYALKQNKEIIKKPLNCLQRPFNCNPIIWRHTQTGQLYIYY